MNFNKDTKIEVKNCIIRDNTSALSETTNETSEITYSNVDASTDSTWFGIGSINQEALFVDTTARNFRLDWKGYPKRPRAKSPCIDAGDPDYNYTDPDSTRADMGAVYFPHTKLKKNRAIT